MNKTKLIVLLIALQAIIASCSRSDFLMEDNPFYDEVISYNVGSNTALRLAEVTGNGKEVKNFTPIVQDNDTLLFICNYYEGWIVISADKRAKPILGRSDNGELSLCNEYVGPKVWVERMAMDILLLKKDNVSCNKDNLSFWRFFERITEHEIDFASSDVVSTRGFGDVDTSVYGVCCWVKRPLDRVKTQEVTRVLVPHLIKTKWGQRYPWNCKFPTGVKNDGTYVDCPTGCVAVAMAQLLYYYHYSIGKPSGLFHDVTINGNFVNNSDFNITISRSNYVQNSPRWDQMPMDQFGLNPEYVCDLMADVGYRVEMSYGCSGSGADISVDDFLSFNLNCSYSSIMYDRIVRNITGTYYFIS